MTKIVLRPAEKFLAKLLEANDAVALGIPEDDAIKAYDGSRYGAIIAVAKALNIFPNLHGTDADMISHSNDYSVRVLWCKQQEKVYGIKHDADIIVLCLGDISGYEIVGFCWRKNLIKEPEGTFHVFHHVFNPIDETKINQRTIVDDFNSDPFP